MMENNGKQSIPQNRKGITAKIQKKNEHREPAHLDRPVGGHDATQGPDPEVWVSLGDGNLELKLYGHLTPDAGRDDPDRDGAECCRLAFPCSESQRRSCFFAMEDSPSFTFVACY